MDRLKAVCVALVRATWPQLVTQVAVLLAIGLCFPARFVIGSIAVVVAAVWQVGRRSGLTGAPALQDPLLGTVLIGSGLASIALTMKWWFVEKQMQLAAGSLLYLAGHTDAATDPTLAWSSVLTQWGSCLISLVITVIWAIRGGHVQ